MAAYQNIWRENIFLKSAASSLGVALA